MKKWKNFKLNQEEVKRNSCQLVLVNFLVQAITVKIMFIIWQLFLKGEILNVVRCVLRTKREYTHVYILSFELCKYLNLHTHTHSHTHLQKTNDMRFYWRSNVAQLKHPAPHYTNTREIIR